MAWKSRKSVIPPDDIYALILDKYGATLDIKQLAEFAGICLKNAYSVAHQIPHKVIGRQYRFAAIDIAKWWRKE